MTGAGSGYEEDVAKIRPGAGTLARAREVETIDGGQPHYPFIVAAESS